MTIIFDIGNVILPFDPLVPAAIMARQTGLTAEEVIERIYRNNLERGFEAGAISPKEFTDGVNRVLGIDWEQEKLRALWVDMFSENTDVSALIRRLKQHYPLVLLSNTNVWHWQFARETYAILREFEKTVLSFEVGVLKPDPKIYHAAMALADGDSEAVFFDDMQRNVDGARAAGLDAVRFKSAAQVEAELRQRGCRW